MVRPQCPRMATVEYCLLAQLGLHGHRPGVPVQNVP